MAGFRMHVGTSTVLGCGYAGVLALGYGVDPDTAIVSGAMCGFGGMLPDLDSDYGVPLRETMAFTAAIIPMLHGQAIRSTPPWPRLHGAGGRRYVSLRALRHHANDPQIHRPSRNVS